MAKNFLDSTGVALVWSKIKLLLADKVDKVEGKGLSSNDYTSDEKTKLANIAAGAQVNVLEGIQKNGQSVTITNKIANITVPTKTSDITNDSGFITTADIPEGAAASTSVPLMDGTAAVGTELAFARGDHRHPTDTSRAAAADLTALEGRVDTLENNHDLGDLDDVNITSPSSDAYLKYDSTTSKWIDGSLSEDVTDIYDLAVSYSQPLERTWNGKYANVKLNVDTALSSTSTKPVQNKVIKSAIDTVQAAIPTNNNQLTNGAGYQTASDVSTAIANAIGDLEGVSFSIVESLPATGDPAVIYLVADASGSGNDVYDEFIWLSDQSKFEKIGRTDVDLSDYYNTTNLVPITSAEIDQICV